MESFNRFPEATHYDQEKKQAIKLFDDTIDYVKNTGKAEVMSGKNKGLFTIVNLDNLVDINQTKMVAEIDGGGDVPMGADFDPQAPWNKESNPEIESYEFDDENQQFEITLTNNDLLVIDYIDVLEDYWKNHPGSFEDHYSIYGHLDDQMDKSIIQKLKDDGFDFQDTLESIAYKKGLI